MITLHQLLKAAVNQGASDLHIVSGSPPVLRVSGSMVRVKSEDLNSEDTRRICYSILTDTQKNQFEESKELDFSFGVKSMARFRANFFYQKGCVSAVFRRISVEIPELDLLGLPKGFTNLSNLKQGLVLVTGPTGSGKSTSLASLIDKINREKRGHILTLEDPIEYIHNHKKSIVNQREVGIDTGNFKEALKYMLRQDSDVCLVGELRDYETILAALTIAETGHLVFATLHTSTAISTIDRIIGVFPGEQQERVRLQLSQSLTAVLSQRLVQTNDGKLVAACEYLQMNAGIRNLVRENKLHQVYGMMQVGQDKSEMVTMNQSLLRLVMKRKVSVRSAFSYSPDPEELDTMLTKMGV